MRSFLVALAFLTVLLPIRFREMPGPDVVARSRYWYPLVGLLLGAFLGGVTALASRLPSPLVAAFLILLAWVGSTGALHLDGFCDLCDGLFGGHTPADRLHIMKDPHLGTFGLAGGVLLLLGKFVFLSELVRHPETGPWLVAAAVTMARCSTLCLAAGARYPREEGTGKFLVESVGRGEGWLGALAAALVAGMVLTNLLGWLVFFAPGVVSVLGLRWLCQRRLGGITGDCLGAGVELVEIVCLGAAVFAQGPLVNAG